MPDGPQQCARAAGSLGAALPSGVLVIGAIASVQFGSSLAATLFARLGPGGTVLLRLGVRGTRADGRLWRPGA